MLQKATEQKQLPTKTRVARRRLRRQRRTGRMATMDFSMHQMKSVVNTLAAAASWKKLAAKMASEPAAEMADAMI